MSLLNEEQNNTWSKKIAEFHDKHPGYKVIYLTITGSKMYGLDTEKSDTDIKGIFIPSKRDLFLQKVDDVFSFNTQKTMKNTSEDIDFTLFSIHHFLQRFQKSEANAVEIFFSMFRDDIILIQSEESLIIKNYLNDIPTKIDITPFIRFGESFLKKTKNNGDKPLSHALRLSYHALELFETNHITFPIHPEWKEQIMKVKLGQVEFIDTIKMIQLNIDKVEPEDYEQYSLNDLLLSFYQ